MFFAIGAMITWEVIARYVFLAPTIWAEEMSRFFQIWATYLAAAFVLRHRDLITIDLLIERLGGARRRTAEVFSLVTVLLVCGIAVYHGVVLVVESIEMGRATSTMLAVPLWMTESAVPVGFTLLALQALVELVRVLRGTSRSGVRKAYDE
jgi:TRAP-type C4-dicarboxylate transport system permease small subunit